MNKTQGTLKYKSLGNTGVQVSEICLGAMTFTINGKGSFDMPSANEQESFEMLNYFAQQGGNFIDTAFFYQESEAVLGKWLSTKKRSDFVIATKAQIGMGIHGGLSRKGLMESVAKSLKDLQTDYIDLYQAHAWDANVPLEDTLRAFTELVRSGKVRYIGVSNWTGAQLQRAADICKYTGLERIVCLQPQYNLLCRNIEWDLLKVCEQEHVAVIPWSPLAGGLLSGKHKRGAGAVQGSRAAWADSLGWKATSYQHLDTDKTWNILDTVSKVAKETGLTEAQVSLRWLTQKPGVTAPIIGAKNMEQLKSNLDCLKKELSAEQMKALDDASATPAPYPWTLF